MACEAIYTGSRFLAATLANLDCQGRTIGAYGYGALANPGSTLAQALTGILTISIALYGIRILTGARPGPRTLVDEAVRVGLFLALVTSWPAWRVVAYDLVLDGPDQIAAVLGSAAGLPGSAGNMTARLQEADDGMVALTIYGSGRLTGGISGGTDLGDAVSGIALADQTVLGSGRAMFLATAIGVTGLLRIGAGLLLALAPLMAGLLLFAGTRAVFIGWLRGLGFCALGSLAFEIVSGVELAVLYPWLTDILAQRHANVLTPSAPTELFVLTLAFALATVGVLLLVAKIMFLPSSGGRAVIGHHAEGLWNEGDAARGIMAKQELTTASSNRAQMLAASVSGIVRREQDRASSRIPDIGSGERSRIGNTPAASLTGEGRLGQTWRRASRRTSLAGQRRDQV